MIHILNRDPFVPEDLLRFLEDDPFFKKTLSKNVGIGKVYSLKTHTLAVMRLFERYFAGRNLPGNASPAFFRLLLALHDIGKPEAIASGDKRRQHFHTKSIIDRITHRIPLPSDEMKRMMVLLEGDALGEFMKGQSNAEDTAVIIADQAGRCEKSANAYLDLLTIYYQMDVAAYTSMAGIMNVLDDLFDWDAKHQEIVYDKKLARLRFKNHLEKRYGKLQENLNP